MLLKCSRKTFGDDFKYRCINAMSFLVDARFIGAAVHYVFVYFFLLILSYVLPIYFVETYQLVSYVLLGILLARFTFEFMKDGYFQSKIDSRNKVVLITGCDTGFGHELAKRLDSKGFHVFASCLFPSGQGAERLRDVCSKRLQIVELDVTKDESVRKAADIVQKSLGSKELWAVVNNAGIIKGHMVDLTPMEEFKDCLEVNTLGQVRVTKAFLPLLKKSKGRVVNLNSLSGRFSIPYFTPYIISKFAAVAFTECLRQELDVWGIKVISVEPEFFQTQLTSREHMGNVIEASYDRLDNSIRDSYGEPFLKGFKTIQQNFFASSSPDVHYVIDALESSVCLVYPGTVYRPFRNSFAKLLGYAGERVPKCFVDYFVRLGYIIFHLPVPKDCSKCH